MIQVEVIMVMSCIGHKPNAMFTWMLVISNKV